MKVNFTKAALFPSLSFWAFSVPGPTTKKTISLLLLAAVCFAQKGNRKLVWEENFDGATLSEKHWNFEYGDHGWGNNERQDYGRDNHKVANGMLTITAKRTGDKYTSTRITTKGKKEFLYGYMEGRAKLPVGKGIWPAFWMLGANISEVDWPKCGEIDILEYIGREPDMVYTTVHTTDNNGGNAASQKTRIEDIEEGFHLFACEWNKDKIAFYVDNKLVYTYQPQTKTGLDISFVHIFSLFPEPLVSYRQSSKRSNL